MGKKATIARPRVLSGYSRRASAALRRRKPPRPVPPPLTIPQILAWADAHHQRTGKWPNQKSGRVCENPFQTWNGIDLALKVGYRGLPGGSSLARLLMEHRGMRSLAALPKLTIPQILAWADAHHERTGQWPNRRSGHVEEEPSETWKGVDHAFAQGGRGLPRGSSLARLLMEHRQRRNKAALPRLTIRQILAWADAHHQRTGEWPVEESSGPVQESHGETWCGIGTALRHGFRGFRGGSSLAKLLARHRSVRNRGGLPPLTIRQILMWADAHRARTGKWPSVRSGPVADAPGESWVCINATLHSGGRGLPAGLSLNAVLAEHRKMPKGVRIGSLSIKQILLWAGKHRRRTGRWPSVKSGPVGETSGATWEAIDLALRKGSHGLPGGSSLHRLLHKRRGGKRAPGCAGSEGQRNLGSRPRSS